LPVFPGRVLAPDWTARGETLDQDTRWALVGNTSIATPTSAMIVWAPWRPMPVISSEAVDCGKVGRRRPVEAAGERLNECGILDPQPSFGQLGEYAGVAFACDHGGQHGPGGDPHDVGGHGRQLDQGVFEQLFDPLDVAGPFAGQVSPKPGVVA